VTDRSVLSRADAGATAHAGVALGVARAAIDAFIEIANRREITIAALAGQRVLLRTATSAQVTTSKLRVWSDLPSVTYSRLWAKSGNQHHLRHLVHANRDRPTAGENDSFDVVERFDEAQTAYVEDLVANGKIIAADVDVRIGNGGDQCRQRNRVRRAF
jgi:alkylation response protein AidB-like acyl-CoA dehydrogenase